VQRCAIVSPPGLLASTSAAPRKAYRENGPYSQQEAVVADARVAHAASEWLSVDLAEVGRDLQWTRLTDVDRRPVAPP